MDFIQYFDNSRYEEICEILDNSSHRIGGYANFAEEDPRNNPEYKDYTILVKLEIYYAKAT